MDWLVRAGWMAWPLGACAVAALTLFLERWMALRARHVVPAPWAHETLKQLAAGAETEAEGAPAAHSMVVARRGAAKDRRSRVEAAGAQLVSRMERGVSWLATIASLAPLLGLTGTVLGMIDVFQRITLTGGGDARVLANGIWMALVTTVLGLLVAMPTLVLHRLLEGRLAARVASLEAFGEQLLEVDPAP